MNHTEQQRAAIEATAPRLCVEASAGSGKTRVLVDRIVHLIESKQADLDEIVAITFTEKAAAEMKTRLRHAFRQRAPEDDAEAMSRWRDHERRVDSSRISTIHGFCSTILRESALWIGLDPDFAVMTEPQTQLLTDQLVHETLHELLESNDYNLTRLATEIPLREIGTLLKMALRRRTLLARTRAQFSFDQPEELVKQWREAAEGEQYRKIDAVQHASKLRGLLKKLQHFEGHCNKPEEQREVLRHDMIKALNSLFQMEEGRLPQRRTHITKILEELSNSNARGKKANWSSPAAYDAVKACQDKVRDFARELLTLPNDDPTLEAAAAQRTYDFVTTFQHVSEAYRASKEATNTLDFEDMIGKVLMVLRDDPILRKRIATSIKHLLVDEFQDTDAVQLELIRLLTDESDGPNLFIVGDAKQSIYLFRGAEVEVFQAEKTRADKCLRLDRNFRTLPEILNFANDFFEETGLLSAVESYAPMTPHRNPVDQPRVEFLVSNADIESSDKQLAHDYRSIEANNIVARITALCHGEAPLEVHDEATGVTRPAQYGDIALLFQAMTEVHLYEEAFRRANIPYALSESATFYRQQEVTDVINLLKILVDAYDEYALLGFLRGPMGNLSDDEILHLANNGTLAAAFWGETSEDDASECKALGTARYLLDTLRMKTELTVADLLRFLLENTGYEAILLAQYRGIQKAANVRKLIRLAEEFTKGTPTSLRAYVYYLEEMRTQSVRETDTPTQPGEVGAVTLMTIHKSKGLEFPIVFIPDMQRKNDRPNKDRLFLHRELGMSLKVTDPFGDLVKPAIGDAIAERCKTEEGAESARKLYVAMTRARDCLILCGGPGPKSGSWFEIIDTYYHISEKEDGDVIAGKDWNAIVHCNPEGRPTVYNESATEQVLPPRQEILERICPLRHTSENRKSFSISDILDHLELHAETERRHETTAHVSPSGHALDAMERGSLVHHMFEVWDFASDAIPPLEDIVKSSGCSLRHREALTEDLQNIVDDFRDNPLFARLAADTALQREAPFLLNLGDALITGTIDVLLSDGTLVDYKTGAFDEERNARYKWQLLLYAIAVEKLLGMTPKKGFLYYVDEGKLHEHPLHGDRMNWALQHAREAIAALQTTECNAD